MATGKIRQSYGKPPAPKDQGFQLTINGLGASTSTAPAAATW